MFYFIGTYFRINSYLPKSLALFHEINNEGLIDIFCNNIKNTKTIKTNNFLLSDLYGD